MPRLSFAQEIDEMERLLATVRSRAQELPPLAHAVAGEIAARLAEVKELKRRREELLAAQMEATGELTSLLGHGTRAARELRAYVVLALGVKDARLSQFGIGIRGRRRRQAAKPSAAPPESPPESPRGIAAGARRPELAADLCDDILNELLEERDERRPARRSGTGV